MAKFKEGDRVRFIYQWPCSIPWRSEGTVGEINGTILVKWDNCTANWVGESCLELVDLKPSEEETNARLEQIMKAVDDNCMNATREVGSIIHHSNFVKAVVSEINAYQVASGKKAE